MVTVLIVQVTVNIEISHEQDDVVHAANMPFN